jgi:hypothetical protein
VSFTLKAPTEPERFHLEIMTRLDKIEQRLAALPGSAR